MLEGAPPEHVVPPDGCTSLVTALRPGAPPMLLLSGPWLRPLVVPVRPGERFAGCRVQPGAARELLGVEPAGLTDTSTPAAPLLGQLADRIAAAVAAADGVDAMAAALDATFAERLATLQPPDPLVARAAEQLAASAGETPIAELARDLGIADRTLLRRFRRAVGLTPKQFARIHRLVATIRALLDGHTTWSRLAARGGYADQAHLSRDVAELTGVTPTAFADRVRATRHDLSGGMSDSFKPYRVPRP